MQNLSNKSAVQLIDLIKTKAVSCKEVTQFFIDKIEEVNPAINAIVIKLYNAALAKAEEIDLEIGKGNTIGRLAGLPFTIKECLDLKGTPSTLGLLRRKNDFPIDNDPYIDALLKEDGIILGKTNVAQLLMYFESSNPVYGVTNNPHSSKHSCGGSSGGEGAIIAAGGSPIGVGTDIGGSLRIPAAFCGICSIKPTMGRTIDMTRFTEEVVDISIKSVTGVLGNYAEDLQLFLEIMNEASASKWKVEQLQDFKDVDVSQLKIGYYLSDVIVEPMPAIKRAILESVQKMKDLGAEVIEFTPPNLLEIEELFFRIVSADDGPLFAGNLQKDIPMPHVKGLLMLARASSFMRKLLAGLLGLLGQKSVKRIVPYFGGKGPEYQKELLNRQTAYVNKYLTALDNSVIGKLDAIISPVCAVPAFLHNTADKLGLGGTYTILNNVTGFPAGVATVSTIKAEEVVGRKKTADLLIKTASKVEASSAGLPIGIQIAARPWNEHIVLALIDKLHVRV